MLMFLATVLATAAVLAPTTEPATNVGATGATLNGTVDGAAMDVHFEYGTTASGGYALATAPQTVAAAGDVTAAVSGLTGETEYHYRIVADGVTGDEGKFTTTANPLPPTISNQRTREVTTDSATASASVDANGTPTTYIVEWGTTNKYGSQTAAASAGTGTSPSTVTAKITARAVHAVPLAHGGHQRRGHHARTRPHVPERAGALGSDDRALAQDGSVGRDVRLGGRVTGTGVGGMTVALQQQRFPLDQDFTQLTTARTGSDGGYLFTIPALYTTTRYRVVTQTQVVATSPVATARSAVKVGARARHSSRRRAAVEGTVVPGVHGTASLQRYRPRAGWRQLKSKTVAPEDELRTRYRFSVKRPRKRAAPYRLRVVMLPVKGAHVRGTSRSVLVRPRG